MTTLRSEAFGLDRKSEVTPNFIYHYDFRIGEPKISPFPSNVFDELKHLKNINCYYPSHGDFALREMIIKKYYGDHTMDNIAITHGTMGALDYIFRATLGPGLEVLIPDPGFPPYAKLAEFSGAKAKKYFLNLSTELKTCINWDQMETLITDKTALVLINSPHNPTGKILSAEDFLRFKKMLSEHPHISFVLDEIYRELIYDNNKHFEFSHYIDRGYIVGSFSKMYPLQGARIGWVLTSSEKMQKLSPFFNNAAGAMSSFGQEIVKVVLKRKLSFRDHYIRALKVVSRILDAYHVDYIKPEGAFFIFIKYNMNGSDAALELARLGVSVVSGASFGEVGEHYIRVSFAQEEETLRNGFAIIAKHWSEAHPRTLH